MIGQYFRGLDRSLYKRVFSITPLAGLAAFLRRSRLTGLDTPLINPQCVTGENGSILIGLRAALGLGLLSFRPPGLN